MLAAGVVCYLLFYLGREYIRGGDDWLSLAFILMTMNWMVTIFLITVILLVVDIVTGFGLMLRWLVPYLRGLALVAGVLLSLIAVVLGMRPPVIRDYNVSLDELPAGLDGAVAMVVSDTHLGALIDKEWAEKLVGRILEQKPDIVLLVGDIFDGPSIDRANMIPVLAKLSAPLGVWAVLGNHDSFRRGTAEYYLEAGYKLLRNEWHEVAPGLVLAGVDNLRDSGYGHGEENWVEQALAGRPTGATIFMSHKPLQAELAAGKGADLMLSGHTHGGQVWPFGYFVKKHYPLFAGRYQIGGMTAIVSRGAGTWGPRMRLWHPGEILRIVLTRGGG